MITLAAATVDVPDISAWAEITFEPRREGGLYRVMERTHHRQVAALKYIRLNDIEVQIDGLQVTESHRRQRLALVLIDHLYRNHPGMTIHPGRMTLDGNTVYEYLLCHEPIARKVGGKAWLINDRWGD